MKLILTLTFFLLIANLTFAQNLLIGNVVNAEDGKPIQNVTIIFPKANMVAFSDAAGQFSISLPEAEIPEARHIAYDILGVGLNWNNNPDRPSDNDSITILMVPKSTVFTPVEITSFRVQTNAPVTYTNISGEALNQINFGEDMPFLLESTPSAVVTSDAGNGIGYTGLRIRGSDATRVNITINGVPYNDAESQQTYWVNLPDFAASVDDIQIQRGVGTSTNGVSSFGASVNINTNKLSASPFVNVSGAIGSFNLSKKSIAIGTGLINNKWTFEGRYSDIYADGFIDRANADLKAYFLTGAYDIGNYKSILNIFSGTEKTYQSWAGVPAEIIDTNRTFNPYTYENQTDNYLQTHYQWHHILKLKKADKLKLTFNYTKGSGYFEQYENDQSLTDYGVEPVVVNDDTVFTTDLITQKWLDNKFAGVFVQYEKYINSNINWNIGAAYYNYNGLHFGNVIWSQYASTFGNNYEWYRNNSVKNDGNVFTQFMYENDAVSFLADLQVRNVNYQFVGLDAFGSAVEQNVNLLFVNPKVGITFLHNNKFETYIYAGISSKEPNRDDYVASSPQSRPDPERLYNLELGERMRLKGWQFMANYYMMYYANQLVLTGEINDVGAYTRTNIPESYRTGIELAFSKLFFNKLKWEANATFSRNIITEFTEYVDNWDTGIQTPIEYSNTAISFSPNVIGYNSLKFTLFDKTNANNLQQSVTINCTSKYVGQQFADNTSDNARSLEAYLVHDAGLNYHFSNKIIPSLDFTINVQNLANLEYESNAWVYRFIADDNPSQFMGYYPQAGINWNAGLVLKF